MISYDTFVEAAGKIPYQYRHPQFLYALVKWFRPKTVVEVGTHIGMSAVWMARALQENGEGKLYCIDNFCWIEEKQEEQWITNVLTCDVRNTITLIKGRSQDVEWPGTIDMAYIDGNHAYHVCKHDVQKARDLGATCIILHDTVACDGSRKYAWEMRMSWSGWDLLEVNFDQGLMIAKKIEVKPPMDKNDVSDKWDKCKS
jgi:predicted O-methyltransferase YrrM